MSSAPFIDKYENPTPHTPLYNEWVERNFGITFWWTEVYSIMLISRQASNKTVDLRQQDNQIKNSLIATNNTVAAFEILYKQNQSYFTSLQKNYQYDAIKNPR
jgi:hypothetical protein